MKVVIRILSIFIISLLLNCILVNKYAYKRPERSSIQIFFSQPDAPYTVIGTIAKSDDDFEDLIEDLQDAAIDMGGNAIIVTNQTSTIEQSGMIGGTNGIIFGGSNSDENVNYLVQIIKLFKKL